MYKHNPKTEGSGIIGCIPQTGKCPNNCEECFYQSGRSFLEPLNKNLPNIPSRNIARGRVVRMNDGNDSNIEREKVITIADRYEDYFFNTAIPKHLEEFPGPVVLTINPGKMTDNSWYKLETHKRNLMFLRIRTNIWNIEDVVKPAVEYYTHPKEFTEDEIKEDLSEGILRARIPIVLTYMAYYEDERAKNSDDYICQKRILNNYWVISDRGRKAIESHFENNPYVYSCGYKGTHSCVECGNCLREYYRVKEIMRKN